MGGTSRAALADSVSGWRKAPGRLFEVRCKACGLAIVTTGRLREAEVGVVTDHLQGCSACQPLGDLQMLGAIMAQVVVTVVGGA